MVQKLQCAMQQKVDLYASVVHASNGHCGQVAAGLKTARVAELDTTADHAEDKIEAGLGQPSVEELERKLVANGNGNRNGGGAGTVGSGVSSAVAGGSAGRAIEASSMCGG